jgi:haloacid dehalogenase superfamily, subfamily IA, variant 3 with third motif having DD or ED/haloacid dehalogenase superfamily, subfamily IA, variant 1 with third motif having Dx(3-4)D or Dx(3-4)E
MVNTVLFDLDGTLIDFNESDRRSLLQLYTRIGLQTSFDEFFDTSISTLMTFHELVTAKKINPLLMHEYRLKNTLALYGIEWQKGYVTDYQNEMIAESIAYTGVLALLSNLHKRVKLGIITNAYDPIEQLARITQAGLRPYFNEITIAGEVGFFKPAPEIFFYTLNKLNTHAEQTVYVGDSEVYDIAGARGVGMKTILIDHNRSGRRSQADRTVSTMDELQAILNKWLE